MTLPLLTESLPSSVHLWWLFDDPQQGRRISMIASSLGGRAVESREHAGPNMKLLQRTVRIVQIWHENRLFNLVKDQC